MVAGRGSRSQNEQDSGEHQPRRRGELRVEAALQNRRRPREPGRLRSGVEAGGPVDEENHGEAGKAEEEHDATEAAAAGPGGEQADCGRDRADRDE
jgi:hypothetical protein